MKGNVKLVEGFYSLTIKKYVKNANRGTLFKGLANDALRAAKFAHQRINAPLAKKIFN